MAPRQHLRSILGRSRTSPLAFPAVFTTLLLGATLALSACGAQEAGAAAIVNGTVISDRDVQTVAGQLNTISQGGEKLSSSNVLLSLILAPYVISEAQSAGKTVSTSQARQVIAKVADPAPSTIEFVQVQLAIQQLDQTNRTSIVNEVGKAKITINPRYGTFDATKIELTAISPNWFPKASAASPAK